MSAGANAMDLNLYRSAEVIRRIEHDRLEPPYVYVDDDELRCEYQYASGVYCGDAGTPYCEAHKPEDLDAKP